MPWQDTVRFFALVTFFGVTISMPSLATHTTFEYRAERFEVSGNLPGFIADEFDDGIVSPWTPRFGTIYEENGHMVLTDPGVHSIFPGAPNIILDRSDVDAPATYNVQDGFGDFTAISEWLPVIPDLPGGLYGTMMMNPLSPTTVETISLHVLNISQAIVDESPHGGVAGLQIAQSRLVFETGGNTGTVTYQENHLFDPVDLTGNVVMRLSFNDSNNQMTQSFSLDGGSTFHSPFTPIPTTLDAGIAPARWQLIGDPATLIPEPSTALLLSTGLLGLAAHRRGRVGR
jgi:hypothetical protein